MHDPVNDGIDVRATADTDSGDAVRQPWATSLDTERSIAAQWWYFWDELTAEIAVDTSIATISVRPVVVCDNGVTVQHDAGTPALVASAADPETFEQRFLKTFAGGQLPAVQLNSDDEKYLGTVRSTIVELSTAVHDAFAAVEQDADDIPADELAAQLVDDVFDAMNSFREEPSAAEGPDSMRPQDGALFQAAATFLDTEATYLEALNEVAPTEPVGVDNFFELFFSTTEAAGIGSPFEAFETACADSERTAYALGATDTLCLQ